MNITHCDQSPIFVVLRNSQKYQPIEVKTSDDITDGMVHVKSKNNLSVRSKLLSDVS